MKKISTDTVIYQVHLIVNILKKSVDFPDRIYTPDLPIVQSTFLAFDVADFLLLRSSVHFLLKCIKQYL